MINQTENQSRTFSSILLNTTFSTQEPACFPDLHLHQLVSDILEGWEEYDLEEIFYTPLASVAMLEHRQEIMQDLQEPAPFAAVSAFSESMRAVRQSLQSSAHSPHELPKERWFLDAVERYCEAVAAFKAALDNIDLRSQGLRSFKSYLSQYASSPSFAALARDARNVSDLMRAIRFSLVLKQDSVTVQTYVPQPDYAKSVEKTFARFREDTAKDYRAKLPEPHMGLIEVPILERVAKLNRNAFSEVSAFCKKYARFTDEVITKFDREIQFYRAYLQYIEPLLSARLPFCYPNVDATNRQISVRGAFDIALAKRLVEREGEVVQNDFELRGREKIFVVTGPNQGGKTTFARSFGQIHFLGSLGLPVPAHHANLFLFDNIFTHFEAKEVVGSLEGKLQDDLNRVRKILERMTPNSIVILNEVFSSTSVEDGILLSNQLLESLLKVGSLGVWVTFLYELASAGDEVVSLVAGVEGDDSMKPSFKVERRQALGLAHALAIADKYKLSYNHLRARLAQ